MSETVTLAAADALGIDREGLTALHAAMSRLRAGGSYPRGGEAIAVALSDAMQPDDVQVEGTPSIAAGFALAFAIRGDSQVAVSLSSEGASAGGDLHEAMNLAGVRRLPIVFVIDNDQFDGATPAHLNFACGALAERAAGYGMPGVVADGTDVLACLRELRAACERARAGDGPTLVELTRPPAASELAPDELTAAALELDPIARLGVLLQDEPSEERVDADR